MGRVFWRFLLAGSPGLVVAICPNLFLLKVVGWPGPPAYAVVLVVQVSVNFFFCLMFVFERNVHLNVIGQFFAFVSGIPLTRVFEWFVYVALTELLGTPYLAAQLLNAAVFSLAKFTFARRTIEGNPGFGKSI
jgi:putative flippase GtrA